MDNILEKLFEVKTLIIAMSKTNNEEISLKNKIMPYYDKFKFEQKKVMPTLMKILFVIIFLLIYGVMVFNEVKFRHSHFIEMENVRRVNYELKHGNTEGFIPEKMPILTFVVVALMNTLPGVLSITLAIFIIYYILAFGKNITVNFNNKRIRQRNSNIEEYNQRAAVNNKIINEKIQELVKRRQLISQEYNRHVNEWYPRDYAYLEAVNFFINKKQNFEADTIKEMTALYNEYHHRRKMEEGQIISIGNQQVMISQNDAILREQMLGNLINFADFYNRWM